MTRGNDGSIYLGGTTRRNLDGQTNAGSFDAFLTKYNPDGTKTWTRLSGSAGDDYTYALTTGADGSIYAGGHTERNLDGQTNSGSFDAFIIKYNPDGTKVWTRLLGGFDSENLSAVARGNDGAVYVIGSTYGRFGFDGQTNRGGSDIFIAKYNPDGTKVWTRLLGSDRDDWGYGATVGADGSIYVGGTTYGNLDGQNNTGGADAFITKYNPDGTKVWTRLLGGSGSDSGFALTADGNGFIYFAGASDGNLDGQTNNGNSYDGFIAKYNADGTKVWTRLVGGAYEDFATALTSGSDGSIYMGGSTESSFDGQGANVPGYYTDAFISKYNSDGTRVWTRLLGGNKDDAATAVITGGDGAVYVAGNTRDNLDGQTNSGSEDAFITKYVVNNAVSLAIAATNATQTEGNSGTKAFTFTVTRSGGTTGTNSVNWALTASGTNPVNGGDFLGGVLPSGVVSFAAGETSKAITINVAGDTSAEPDETFTLTLTNPGGGALIAGATATGTIQNDDTVLTIVPTRADRTEGNISPTPFTFTVTRSGTNTGTNSLNWRVSGSGTNPANTADFPGAVLPSGSISFAPGETSKVITFNVAGDTSVEANETFTVTIANPTGGATIAGATATGTIQNDDLLNNPSPIESWTRLLGTGYEAKALTPGPDGSIYVSGNPFIIKYNSDGTTAWTRFSGGSGEALARSGDGSIYVSGYTSGNLDGQINSGKRDAYVSKYDDNGTRVWTRLLGTVSDEVASALTVGADGSIYVSGATTGNLGGQTNSGDEDGFIAKYNADGTRAWTRILGTSGIDRVNASTIGRDGFIYVSGYTTGNLHGETNKGSGDAFIAKYNPDGTRVWTRLLGTGSLDSALGMTTGNDGSLYISGATTGDLDGQIYSGGGSTDAFIAKYNPDGSRVWTRILGTIGSDVGRDLTIGTDGSIYMGGVTDGIFDTPNAGTYTTFDGFISKYTPDGTRAWARGVANSAKNYNVFAYAVTVSGDGSLYAAGQTNGPLASQTNIGGTDAFVRKFIVNGLDKPPTFAIAATNAAQTEGNSGTKAFTFTITRSGNTLGINSVSWRVTGSGTTPANSLDFQGERLPGTFVTFAPGETAKVITVNVAGDTIGEPNETFSVTLSNPTNTAVIGTATATGTIQNDDTVQNNEF